MTPLTPAGRLCLAATGRSAPARGGQIVTVLDAAHYFLTKPDRDTGDNITHLKLQKLCYYAQAWHLALLGDRLFDAAFEAWAHGPVCRDLWDAYRDSGWHPIPPDEEFDPNQIDDDDRIFLDEVWNAYGKFTAKHLEEMAHQETPWIEARRGLPPGARCNIVISDDSMRSYYAALAE